ncbi:MAG: methionyl-tRNA formyltransferase [Anaerolineaceae bacterium]
MKLSIVFMGSPEFSLPALKILHRYYQIRGVITQPDKPAGRGKVLTPPPVKILAESLGLTVIQPIKLRDPQVFDLLSSWKPDMIVVSAYGQILRQNVLDLPRYGCINIHPSLLPRWRGASPIPFTLLAGDEITGVTIMKMDAGMDTGPLLAQVEEKILPEDNAQTLHDRLSEKGADLLLDVIPKYMAGEIIPVAQDNALATYSRLISKDDGLLEYEAKIDLVLNQIRAFNPWPGVRMTWKETPLKIIQAHGMGAKNTTPGKRVIVDSLPAIELKDGRLILDQIQPAGKRPMSGRDFLRGARDWA